MLNRFSKVRDGFSHELNMLNAHRVKIIQDVETVDSSLAGSLQAVNTSLATFAASVLTVA